MITLPLLIVIATGIGAATFGTVLGGWWLASKVGWLIGADSAPRGTFVAAAIATLSAASCFAMAAHPAFWSVP